MKKLKNKLTNSYQLCLRFSHSVWFFPSILFLILAILTGLRINGSSVGVYDELFYGNGHKNDNLILNEPRRIRSDEWLVTTQLTIAQHAAGYPQVNTNIQTGKDMTIIGDAPFRGWSEIFRPENYTFLIMPLEYAFAFRWWLLLYLVIVGSYFLVLRFFSTKRLLAAIMGSAFGLSPFLFWWYGTGTFAALFYGIFAILIGWRVINDEPVRFLEKRPLIYSYAIYAVVLGYILTCFGMILYPPFQIPIAITVGLFWLGLWLNKYGGRSSIFLRRAWGRIGIMLTGVFIAGVLMLAFLHTRPAAIQAISQTVYPGHRQVEGGGTPVFKIFATQLQPQLEDEGQAAHYYENASESSNFLLILPFLILPSFVVLWLEYRQNRRLNWPLLLMQAVALLFLANLFTPSLQPLYNLLFLDKVPHNRLFLAMGLVNLLQLLLVIRSIGQLKLTWSKLNWAAGLYGIISFSVLVWAGEFVRDRYPLFIKHQWLVFLYALMLAFSIYCLLSRKLYSGALMLLILSYISVHAIHPIYRGLTPAAFNPIYDAIDRVSTPDDTWVALDSIMYENFPAMAGRPSLSGVQPYPNVNFWRQVEGPQGDYIYNRYAHVVFASGLKQPLQLVQDDAFLVQFGCTPFVLNHIKFALSPAPLDLPCVELKDTVHYPRANFYLYKIQQ